MRIIAISGDKRFYRIGEDIKNSLWYQTDKVKDIPVSKGDIVELKFEKDASGTNILQEIKVTGKHTYTPSPSSYTGTGETGTSVVNITPSDIPSTNPQSANKEWRSKSPAESEQIRRQSVGYMVAETMKVFNNVQNIDFVIEAVKKLYATYNELTKNEIV